MKIHTVYRGQSPWSIANTYGVPLDKLIAANGLNQIPHLVDGQSLVIPGVGATHTVSRGESIYSIATKYGVTPESIAAANNLSLSEALYPGRSLIIPEKPKRYGTVETNGFIIPSDAERENELMREAAPFLTYIAPFSYQVNSSAGLTPINDENIITQAKNYRTAPMLSVTNIAPTGGFDTKLIDNILNDNGLQNTLINNILSTIERKGYYGTIIDFERISPSNRDKYNAFLRKVVARLNPRYFVATALAPKTYDVREGAWHGAHDYKAHGEIVNFVIIMTYEWGWSGGAALLKGLLILQSRSHRQSLFL